MTTLTRRSTPRLHKVSLELMGWVRTTKKADPFMIERLNKFLQALKERVKEGVEFKDPEPLQRQCAEILEIAKTKKNPEFLAVAEELNETAQRLKGREVTILVTREDSIFYTQFKEEVQELKQEIASLNEKWNALIKASEPASIKPRVSRQKIAS